MMTEKEKLQMVVEENVDTVVMGMRDRDISTLFTGSVAERMFQRCSSYHADQLL